MYLVRNSSTEDKIVKINLKDTHAGAKLLIRYNVRYFKNFKFINPN